MTPAFADHGDSEVGDEQTGVHGFLAAELVGVLLNFGMSLYLVNGIGKFYQGMVDGVPTYACLHWNGRVTVHSGVMMSHDDISARFRWGAGECTPDALCAAIVESVRCARLAVGPQLPRIPWAGERLTDALGLRHVPCLCVDRAELLSAVDMVVEALNTTEAGATGELGLIPLSQGQLCVAGFEKLSDGELPAAFAGITSGHWPESAVLHGAADLVAAAIRHATAGAESVELRLLPNSVMFNEWALPSWIAPPPNRIAP